MLSKSQTKYSSHIAHCGAKKLQNALQHTLRIRRQQQQQQCKKKKGKRGTKGKQKHVEYLFSTQFGII